MTDVNRYRASFFPIVFALLLFCAAFGKSDSRWENFRRTPLPFPFETIVQNRQVVGAVALAGTVLLSLMIPRLTMCIASLSRFELGMILMQAALAIKMLASDMLQFGILSIGVWSLIWFLRLKCMIRWLPTRETRIEGVAQAITLAIFLVCSASIYVLMVSPSAAYSGTSGRLGGIMGNPQFLGVAIALSIASPVYLIRRYWGRRRVFVFFLLIVIALCMFALVKTGSRTAGAATMICLISQFHIRYIIIGVISMPFLFVIGEDIREIVSGTEIRTLIRTNDTRSHIWARQFLSFWENPVLGVPMAGSRPSYEESSWLGLLATTGLMGIPGAIVFGTGVIRSVQQFLNEGATSNFGTEVRFERRFVSSTLFAAFFCGFFEPFLLGTITMSLYITIFIGFAMDQSFFGDLRQDDDEFTETGTG